MGCHGNHTFSHSQNRFILGEHCFSHSGYSREQIGTNDKLSCKESKVGQIRSRGI